MKFLRIWSLSIVFTVLLNSCFLFGAYALLKTVRDVSDTMIKVKSSMTRIKTILDEGKEIKRAAEDGRLIASLAEKIPSLVQDKVEKPIRDNIEKYSSALKVSSEEFTNNALAEDLAASKKSYNNMASSYNEFTNYLKELSQ